MLRIAFVALACLFLVSSATNVKECKGKPFPLSVRVEGCEEPPCEVIKGTTAVMEVQFLGNRNDIKNIEAKVTAKVLGMNLPYDLPEEVSNVCSNLMFGAICPVDKNEDVTYKFNFYVEPAFPEITADVTVTLNDENNDVITCFICSCKLRKGPTQRDELLLESGDLDA
ncbi:uncharacterized protein LOC115625335 [Scaptodrosophila lebanonensis]|uniref:Uncharacterized protein LOC115625335 n=1 Tax=Drosophila lebanonensis TaxID=7225 RepID=A0A6J2TL35_DROLE|nr:uncharacterized protein LOC115625335 [Scaptodrosophila lebanonensis]